MPKKKTKTPPINYIYIILVSLIVYYLIKSKAEKQREEKQAEEIERQREEREQTTVGKKYERLHSTRITDYIVSF